MKHICSVSAPSLVPRRAAILGKEFVCDQHESYVKCHIAKAG